jgi:4-amino-4-deoxy-L-arabinose transferase-like glycosyltransferase
LTAPIGRALHHDRFWLLAIACMALVLRLALWSQPLHLPANDEVEYIAVARDLLAGRGWSFYSHYHWLRAPLYPLFLAASLWLTAGDLHRAALPTLLLSVLNVVLAYSLTDRLVGRRPALLAALITALLWTNATFASLYMAETLFTFLFCAALLALLGAGESAVRRRETQRTRFQLLLPRGVGSYGRAILSGVLFGLAALTRSAVLLFLPVAAVWLAYESYSLYGRTRMAAARAVILAACFLVAVLVPIAPWTLRNARAYGRPILIETGLSYNLWAFNEPREDLDTIQRVLERIPNPADRSDYATERGLARLREDPAILVRKLWPNWVYLARVKPIQDRFLMESYYGSVDLPLFVAALAFDDLLYAVVALGALGGLAAVIGGRAGTVARRRSWLCAAWCAYLLTTLMLTHGEARYRHFLFPVLIPYAAWLLAHGSTTGALLPGRRWSRMALAGAMVVFVWTVATSYPHTWAAENLARGWNTIVGDAARRLGRYDIATLAYERAAAAQHAPDPLLRLGDAAQAAGRPEQALDAYRRAFRRAPIYEPAAARLGDLLRTMGDEAAARQFFLGDYLDQQYMVEWSWRELQPVARSTLDIGGGLDYGYVDGVYPAEQISGATARWTKARAVVRLARSAAAEATQAVLHIRLAAPHPDQARVPVEICAGGRCDIIFAQAGWHDVLLLVRASQSAAVLVELQSPTFRAMDGRELGVLIDRVELR